MMRTRSMLAVLALSLLLAAAGLLGGCAGGAPEPPAESPSPAPLSLMPAADKIAGIAPSFPPQVPVPAGKIVSGQAQGDSAWDYAIVVGGGSESVREWYRQAYTRADWTVVAETGDSLSFEKNAAQSRAVFADEGSGTTRVVVTVGVGTRVLDLQ